MHTLSAVLAAAAVVAAVGTTSHCDEHYDCEFDFIASNSKHYHFDLAPMCTQGGYNHRNETTGQTYWFNVCGTPPQVCSPQGYDVFQRTGPVIQFFGDEPACNEAAPECTNILTGEPECCTKPCEILAYGPPIFSMQDETNPVTGGLRIQHIAAPPTFDDQFTCPNDPVTGVPKSRDVTYFLDCDPKKVFTPIVTSALEVSPCTYEFHIATQYACGCAPACDGKTCGSDGCHGFCGSNGEGGQCPSGQSCDSTQVCRDPPVSNSGKKPSGAYQYTGGEIAGALFGGILLCLVLLVVAYFLWTKGYCAAAWAAVTGAGSRGFKKMPTGGSGTAAPAPATGSAYNSMGASDAKAGSYGSSAL